PDRELAARQPDGLRGHDLIRQRVLDHAVLVDPGLVGERVSADHGLVRLDREPGEIAHEPRRGRDLLSLDPAAELWELCRPRPEGHHDLLEGSVAGALSEAVDRDLDLPGARLDGGERVCGRESKVVVAMN